VKGIERRDNSVITSLYLATCLLLIVVCIVEQGFDYLKYPLTHLNNVKAVGRIMTGEQLNPQAPKKAVTLLKANNDT
jgi:HKD family nuclease